MEHPLHLAVVGMLTHEPTDPCHRLRHVRELSQLPHRRRAAERRFVLRYHSPRLWDPPLGSY